MIERDYILRIIQDIAKFIGKLLKLMQEEDIESAYNLIVEKSSKLVKVDYSDLINFLQEDYDKLFDGRTLSAEYLDSLGRYFLTAGEICIQSNRRGEAQKHFELSEWLLLKSENDFKTFSFDRQKDLDHVQSQLKIMGRN